MYSYKGKDIPQNYKITPGLLLDKHLEVLNKHEMYINIRINFFKNRIEKANLVLTTKNRKYTNFTITLKNV